MSSDYHKSFENVSTHVWTYMSTKTHIHTITNINAKTKIIPVKFGFALLTNRIKKKM